MKISVVIPLFNKCESIKRTLLSLTTQTFKDFEIVIVDDGSTDKSAEIVHSFNDSRIRLISQLNSGVSVARNSGIKEAKGEFVAFLDADDEWRPNYLEKVNFLIEKYPECNIISTDYIQRDVHGREIQTKVKGIKWNGLHGILDNYFEVASQSNPPLWTSAVTIRKKALEEIGGFPVGIKSGEDLLTWARLACRNKIAYSRRPLAIFNIEGYSVKEKPKRVPPEVDIVGEELVKLRNEFHPEGMVKYISFWHRMRSSIYMRLGMRRKSIREALIGLRYNPLNYKLYVFIILNFLPKSLQPF